MRIHQLAASTDSITFDCDPSWKTEPTGHESAFDEAQRPELEPHRWRFQFPRGGLGGGGRVGLVGGAVRGRGLGGCLPPTGAEP